MCGNSFFGLPNNPAAQQAEHELHDNRAGAGKLIHELDSTGPRKKLSSPHIRGGSIIFVASIGAGVDSRGACGQGAVGLQVWICEQRVKLLAASLSVGLEITHEVVSTTP